MTLTLPTSRRQCVTFVMVFVHVTLLWSLILIRPTDAFWMTPMISSPLLFGTSPFRSVSSLLLKRNSKSSDRAYIERSLEGMMGEDWREFRAKLVLQEQHEQQATSKNAMTMTSSSSIGNATNMSSSLGATDSKLIKQGQLGDLFAGAISSIFHSNHNGIKKSKASSSSETNIFDGDCIGGIDYDMHGYSCSDPFASHDEIPAMMQSAIKIDKHRWAHPIPHPEPGSVLIANEKLGGIFHQTVVLIIQHCDKAGSTGVVINRPLDGDLLKVASGQASKLDLSLKLAFASSPVTYGGPVLSDEYSILHSFGQVEGSTKLCPGVYVGGSEELINEVRIRRFDPLKCLFVQGHAAWVPGQLSKEISKGVWYTAAVSSDFILRYAGAKLTADDNPQDLWADILSCMGGQYSAIAQAHEGRGDMRMP